SAAKRPALVPVADGIGGKLLLRGERGGGVVLGPAGRPVAVTEGGLVVPPAARIVGCAEEDLEANAGVLEADAHQLHQVLGGKPDREPALIEGDIAEIADAQA